MLNSISSCDHRGISVSVCPCVCVCILKIALGFLSRSEVEEEEISAMDYLVSCIIWSREPAGCLCGQILQIYACFNKKKQKKQSDLSDSRFLAFTLRGWFAPQCHQKNLLACVADRHRGANCSCKKMSLPNSQQVKWLRVVSTSFIAQRLLYGSPPCFVLSWVWGDRSKSENCLYIGVWRGSGHLDFKSVQPEWGKYTIVYHRLNTFSHVIQSI